MIVLLGVATGTIYAQGVLKPSTSSPEEVVAARKFAMQVIGSNVGEIRAKIKAGNIKDVAANAGSIAALATFLPLVYKEEYDEVYPVAGSEYFYKAEIPDVVAAFANLRVQAEELMKFADAGDRSGVETQTRNLLGACGGCHKPARGKY
ncbi:MAG: cytochrome c [Proteobacteria bacterium]|nr:cytochrome c [Pseudomonadota bacterium]